MTKICKDARHFPEESCKTYVSILRDSVCGHAAQIGTAGRIVPVRCRMSIASLIRTDRITRFPCQVLRLLVFVSICHSKTYG